MTDELLERETAKYRKVYDADVYRPKDSVGARVVPIAYGWLRGIGATTATDWGTGFGRTVRWLRSHGVEAYGIDLISTGDTRDDPECFVGTIWQPPSELPDAAFAFSSDVLEHVPPEKVDESLAAIAERTYLGGWFQIATIPDSLGEKVGETLHETVRPADWWREKVSEFFIVCGVEETDREVRLWFRR